MPSSTRPAGTRPTGTHPARARLRAQAPAIRLGRDGASLRYLPVDRIDADPGQPRQEFDPAGIRALRASIGQVGLIQPLVVEGQTTGRYRIVAGERRLRALRLGLTEEPDNVHFRRAPAIVFAAGAATIPRGPLGPRPKPPWSPPWSGRTRPSNATGPCS